MSVLKKTNDNYDRFILQRSEQQNTLDYFQMKEQLDDITYNDDKMMVDASDDTGNNEKAYNALLQSEILDIGDAIHYDDEKSNENMPTSMTCLQKFSKSRRINKKKYGCFDINADRLFSHWKKTRHIPKMPFKVLDAPALKDDYYLNLLDWSSKNILAVGLAHHIYLWSGQSGKVVKLNDLGSRNSVTSLAWAKSGNFISIGTQKGNVEIWDVNKCKQVRNLEGHTHRVGTIAWSNGWLATGSRDKTILLRDLRSKDDFYEEFIGHKQEVCGMKWSYGDDQLASGGNDNKLLVWSTKLPKIPQYKFTDHVAAVKALAWSPHQHGILVSGGGTADRCIKFWNTLTGEAVKSFDTGSQVCNIDFSKNNNEIVSTHGFSQDPDSQNQIIVWKSPSMKKIASLKGHTYRVLYLAQSPDGQNIVTGAGDETLRFWNVFPAKERQQSKKESVLDYNSVCLR
jgi:cell division cycle 20-like protein 1 (cofactor of APC complex)